MTTPQSSVDQLFLAFQLSLAGRYSIDRELGRGGMGIVYLAREVHLDRMVAIKLLPPDRATDPALREHFVREARLAAKLSHPNIIPIHSVDEAGDFVFYVMAHVHGETLAERVRTRGPLSSSEGSRVLREVAWALSHAHSHGLVHRDVKPDNIMLEFITGRVLVTDFGIASAAHDVALAGASGTPEFMSPEQALGKAIDARSDLYALGITAFYALTGRLPFEGTDTTKLLARQVTEPAPPLASMGVPVARKLALLVDRCVAKDPGGRPPSADALAEQLGAALEQRRELPAALRNFIKRGSRLNGGGTLVSLAALGSGLAAAAGFGGPAVAVPFALAASAATFGYLVHVARRLMRHGFTHSDIGPAFAVEIEQNREERAVEHNRGPGLVEHILKYVARIGGALYGIGLTSIMLFGTDRYVQVIAGLAIMTGGITMPAAIVYLALAERRRDVDTEFWSKFWSGRIGKAAFWVARKLLGRQVVGSAVTHRATELSLGLAAESLFESLPASTREALGDVPGVARRLQEDAQRLRKLYNELLEAVDAAGDAAFSDAHSALRADRDRIHAKLGDAVGALETIRLNLLRLHAGSGSVERLTTHIDLAEQVSAEVERLLAARKEVDRMLMFPRRTATTPA
ncbi:MAG: serine/threonine-protein kinase [Gemmatimonadota bacterium]